MALGINTLESQTLQDLFVGNTDLNKYYDFTVPASTTLSRGCVVAVKTSDSKLYKWDSTKSDGTQNITGILCEDVTTGAGATAVVSVAVVCEANKAVVDTAFGSAVTAGVYNNGNIIIRSIA